VIADVTNRFRHIDARGSFGVLASPRRKSGHGSHPSLGNCFFALVRLDLTKRNSFELRPDVAAMMRHATYGSVPEWPMGAGCKPAGLRLRRFKSFSAHKLQIGPANVTFAGPFPLGGFLRCRSLLAFFR
jgi:hypothetical protein